MIKKTCFFLTLVLISVFSFYAVAEDQEPKEWKLIASFGTVRTVYVSGPGLGDERYLAKILRELVKEEELLTIWFFDVEEYTPTTVPLTDEQREHWKAEYSYDPENKTEKFSYREVTNPGAETPVTVKVARKIKSGYLD